MSRISLAVYGPILKIKPALRFDIGAFLMRLFTYVVDIGCLAMLTLLGYSALLAGTVTSTIAVAQFVFSPLLGRLIDKKGQRTVVIPTSIIMMVGAIAMVANAALQGPFWINYVTALLVGLNASPQAMARTRWVYLSQTQRYPEIAHIRIKTLFSYEGVIDDLAFMIGPAAAIALSSSLFPEASLVASMLVYIVGVFLFLSSRETEPLPGWMPQNEDENDPRSGYKNEKVAAMATSRKSLMLLSSPLRAFFSLALLVGLFFGLLDTVTVLFGQSLNQPNLATVALFVESFISAIVGIIFGSLKLNMRLSKQVVIFAVAIGVGYGLFGLVFNATSMMIIYLIAATTYAPFVIVLNTACEHCVPSQRLTEALSWITSGYNLGVAVGPTIAGAIIDSLGVLAGYRSVGITCLVLILVALSCRSLFRKQFD